MTWGRTGSGGFLDEELFYPFIGEVGRIAARQSFLRRESSFPYSVGAGPHAPAGTITHVLLPLEEHRVELTMAGRVGPPGNLTILGVGFSNETLEFPDFPPAESRSRATRTSTIPNRPTPAPRRPCGTRPYIRWRPM